MLNKFFPSILMMQPFFIQLLLLQFLPNAHATGIHTEEAICPINDQDRVKLYYLVSSNEYGGYDSDGATYSSGMQFRQYAISTCTQIFFSALTDDMKQQFTAEEKRTLQQLIRTQTALLKDPNNPSTWDRYDLAIAFYRWQNKAPRFIGNLYMEAAWTVRDEVVGIHQGLNGPLVADHVLLEGAKELQKNLTSEQRKMVIYNLARVAHRNGRTAIRDQYMQEFLLLNDLLPEEREAAQEFLEYTQKIEPIYLQKALIEFEAHIATNPNDGQVLYLMGDLHRRLGNPQKSQECFKQANLTMDLQDEQRQIIAYFQENP